MLGPTSLKADTVILYNAPEGTLSRVYEVFTPGSLIVLVLSKTLYCRRYPVSGAANGVGRGGCRRDHIIIFLDNSLASCQQFSYCCSECCQVIYLELRIVCCFRQNFSVLQNTLPTHQTHFMLTKKGSPAKIN